MSSWGTIVVGHARFRNQGRKGNVPARPRATRNPTGSGAGRFRVRALRQKSQGADRVCRQESEMSEVRQVGARPAAGAGTDTGARRGRANGRAGGGADTGSGRGGASAATLRATAVLDPWYAVSGSRRARVLDLCEPVVPGEEPRELPVLPAVQEVLQRERQQAPGSGVLQHRQVA